MCIVYIHLKVIALCTTTNLYQIFKQHISTVPRLRRDAQHTCFSLKTCLNVSMYMYVD